MSETKFTPGPWQYRPKKYDDWGVVRSGDKYICQAKDPRVSWDDLHLYRQNKTDPWEANARLIAAAPELYEALNTLLNAPALSKVEGIVAGWNGPPDNPYSPHPPQLGARIETTCGRVYELDKAMKNARAALAKARGEAL